jgi:hypothetical protein
MFDYLGDHGRLQASSIALQQEVCRIFFVSMKESAEISVLFSEVDRSVAREQCRVHLVPRFFGMFPVFILSHILRNVP